MHSCWPTRISNDGVKLFVNDENTIALGISGVLPKEKIKQELLFSIANGIFRKMYKGDLEDVWELEKSKPKFPISTDDIPHFIGITRDRAFICRNACIFPQTGYMTAVGAGARSIIGCYYVVKDIATAFRLTSEIDSLSSPEHMSVMADSLNPYTIG